MGSFRVEVRIAPVENPEHGIRIQAALVDTGAERSCFPAALLDAAGVKRNRRQGFRQATGEVFERWTGRAVVEVGGRDTVDDVVFGEPGDLVLLGARSLEGLNVHVDPVSKRLVDAGPMPMAAA